MGQVDLKEAVERHRNVPYTDREMFVAPYGATLIDRRNSFLAALTRIKARGCFLGAFSAGAAVCARAKIPSDVFLGLSTPQNVIQWRRDIVGYHPSCHFGDTSPPIPKGCEEVFHAPTAVRATEGAASAT